jgi:hypothetical protein
MGWRKVSMAADYGEGKKRHSTPKAGQEELLVYY